MFLVVFIIMYIIFRNLPISFLASYYEKHTHDM